jgi:hypothetical protein
MNVKSRRRLYMLARVGAFGATNAKQFPPDTMGSRLFAIVQSCVENAAKHDTTQRLRRGEARRATALMVSARRALRQQLDAIRRTAKALALDAPAFDRRFPRPRGNGDGRLLMAGRLFAQRARKPSSDFIAHGLPPTFLADLAAAIERFEDAAHGRAAGRRARISAAAGLKSSLDAGFVAVQRLDAIVRNLLEHRPGAIASWRSARRERRTTRRARHQAA